MTNGDKKQPPPSKKPKRFGDVVPEGKVNKVKLTVPDLIDMTITVVKFTKRNDIRGTLRGLDAEIIVEDTEQTLFVDKQRMIDKLLAAEEFLPLEGKIVKGDRFYDIV